MDRNAIKEKKRFIKARKREITELLEDKKFLKELFGIFGGSLSEKYIIPKITFTKKMGITFYIKNALKEKLQLEKHTFPIKQLIYLLAEWNVNELFEEFSRIDDGSFISGLKIDTNVKLLKMNPFLSDEVELWIEMR